MLFRSEDNSCRGLELVAIDFAEFGCFELFLGEVKGHWNLNLTIGGSFVVSD